MLPTNFIQYFQLPTTKAKETRASNSLYSSRSKPFTQSHFKRPLSFKFAPATQPVLALSEI